MNLQNLTLYKWYILVALSLAFVARFVIIGQDLVSTVEVSLSLGFVIFLALYTRSLGGRPEIIWNDQLGVIALLRPWTVEVSAGRLITSVPLGIDLEHSAVKVLRSLYQSTINSKNTSVKFFVVRPFSEGATRVGMMVTARAVRLHNGVARASNLAKSVNELAAVMEGSLRAAYPHAPIMRAGLDDLLGVYSGGVHAVA